MHVKNHGIGPAIISSRYFVCSGRQFVPPHENDELVPALVGQVLGQSVNYRLLEWGLPGTSGALPAGHDFVVARLFFPGLTQAEFQKLINSIKDADFFCEYESLYGQRFTMSSDPEATNGA